MCRSRVKERARMRDEGVAGERWRIYRGKESKRERQRVIERV